MSLANAADSSGSEMQAGMAPIKPMRLSTSRSNVERLAETCRLSPAAAETRRFSQPVAAGHDETENLKLLSRRESFYSAHDASAGNSRKVHRKKEGRAAPKRIPLARMLHERVRAVNGWAPQGRGLAMPRSRPVRAQKPPFPHRQIRVLVMSCRGWMQVAQARENGGEELLEGITAGEVKYNPPN